MSKKKPEADQTEPTVTGWKFTPEMASSGDLPPGVEVRMVHANGHKELRHVYVTPDEVRVLEYGDWIEAEKADSSQDQE